MNTPTIRIIVTVILVVVVHVAVTHVNVPRVTASARNTNTMQPLTLTSSL
jgi:hypothetical protein